MSVDKKKPPSAGGQGKLPEWTRRSIPPKLFLAGAARAVPVEYLLKDLGVTGIYFHDLKAYIVHPSVKRVQLAPPATGDEYDGLLPGDIGWRIDPEGELRVERDRLEAFQHKAIGADVGEVPHQLSRSIIHEPKIEGRGTSAPFSSFTAWCIHRQESRFQYIACE